jgi:hypothetical protein
MVKVSAICISGMFISMIFISMIFISAMFLFDNVRFGDLTFRRSHFRRRALQSSLFTATAYKHDRFFMIQILIHFFPSIIWVNCNFLIHWREKMKLVLNNLWVVRFMIVYAYVIQQKLPNTLLYFRGDTKYYSGNVLLEALFNEKTGIIH